RPGGPAATSGNEARATDLQAAGALDLLGQGPLTVGDDDAGDGLEQDAVLAGDLIAGAHVDPARAIRYLRLRPCCDQPDDLIVQRLPVARVILVPDHQVRGQPLGTPER